MLILFMARGEHSTAKTFYNKSESLCEDALEILQEIVDTDLSLQMWFDRGLDFGRGSLVDAQLGNLPRVTTSRSIDKQQAGRQILSKREVKIATVEMAISALLAVEVADKKERKDRDSENLAEFLNSPFTEDD